MKDKFNREITYARISLTDLCNYRCIYCMGEKGIPKKHHREILSIENMLIIIKALSALGITKIRLTGGEPLLKRGMEPLLKGINACNINNIAITTNGYYLQENLQLLKKYNVKKINVSIDSLDSKIYKQITRGGDIKKVISGIKKASTMGFQLKINSVLLKGLNDNEIYNFAKFGKEIGAMPRFIELMPFDCQNNSMQKYYTSTNDVINKFKEMQFIGNMYSTNAQYYQFDDGSKIGFISPISNKFCSRCNRIRITADGKMLNCLHENREYDLRVHLQDFESLKSYIQQSVMQKLECHNIENGNKQNREMNAIGG